MAASFVDQKASLARAPALGDPVIALATIVALFLMTGSVVLPIKAVIMNLLTLGATLGCWCGSSRTAASRGCSATRAPGALDLTQPILLGAMVFGLSTDYAVFLLSRIKEAHDRGASTSTRWRSASAHRPHHHRGGPAVRRRHRRLRDLADRADQGARGGDRPGGADRRHHHPGAARALADGAARQVELVGATTPPPLPRPVRHQRVRPRPGAGVGAPDPLTLSRRLVDAAAGRGGTGDVGPAETSRDLRQHRVGGGVVRRAGRHRVRRGAGDRGRRARRLADRRRHPRRIPPRRRPRAGGPPPPASRPPNGAARAGCAARRGCGASGAARGRPGPPAPPGRRAPPARRAPRRATPT